MIAYSINMFRNCFRHPINKNYNTILHKFVLCGKKQILEFVEKTTVINSKYINSNKKKF